MKRCTAGLAVALLVGGCGISLDVDPRPPHPTPGAADAARRDAGGERRDGGSVEMDAGASDGGVPAMDGGGALMDAAIGSTEAGAGDADLPPPRDASPPFDATLGTTEGGAMIREGGPAEASVADGAVRFDASATATACGAGFASCSFMRPCLATVAGTCGIGVCGPATLCPGTMGPITVCGCDGTLYDTLAAAYCLGYDVRRPPPTCCFADADCTAGRCVGPDCAGGHAGACRAPPPIGLCWDNRDCPPGTPVCGAAPCNCSACPPVPGACRVG